MGNLWYTDKWRATEFYLNVWLCSTVPFRWGWREGSSGVSPRSPSPGHTFPGQSKYTIKQDTGSPKATDKAPPPPFSYHTAVGKRRQLEKEMAFWLSACGWSQPTGAEEAFICTWERSRALRRKRENLYLALHITHRHHIQPRRQTCDSDFGIL